MIRRPPRSTLFPTRRSSDLGVRVHLQRHRPLERQDHDRRDGRHARGVLALGRFAARDRKSTRLNSSHPSISYAVFCLKKKNKRILDTHKTHTTIRPHQRSTL